jgi:phosphoglycerate dehydrogenase-like enzyme
VPDPLPRLLLVVRSRPSLLERVRRRLPEVPAAVWDADEPPPPERIEAALLGSMARDAAGWDPRSYPRLRFVQRMFAGVDDLPFDRFPETVEIAGNVGGYSPFVAEHAVALALAAARAIRNGHEAVARGRLRPAPEMRTFWHRTAVILGYGSIGREIADRLRGFGLRIVGVNRSGTPALGADEMLPADRLREALARGDVVFDVRPHTRATDRSIGRAELSAMPSDGIYVNVGRAATVDETALYEHLLRRPEFRAALDVWWIEDFAAGRLRLGHPFARLPNFVGSPHCAGNVPPVEEYAASRALENLRRFFAGETPRHLVDRREYWGEPPPAPSGARRPLSGSARGRRSPRSRRGSSRGTRSTRASGRRRTL